eukprot:TRINITY_DN8696_c0_g1_i1.p1 TRINITY_DN8696_c0_g1~~TRINITY_DN8696_c0_g1_i1.p1  ORF type:complete len:681 (-),score=118.64 TRINITY_DN8696_c0_g1_i1:82-2124(-)
MNYSGISQYSLNPTTGSILVPYRGLFFVFPHGDEEAKIVGVGESESPAMYSALSPDDSLLSFVRDGDVHVVSVDHSTEKSPTRVTFSNDGKGLVTAEPKFIIQEEFDRFESTYWSPKFTNLDGTIEYQILYITEDETPVRLYHIAQTGITGEIESSRYPLAGENNTLMEVRILTIKYNPSTNVVEKSSDQSVFKTHQSNDWEYVVRAGWFPEGDEAWIQVFDRDQHNYAFIAINSTSYSNSTILKEEILPRVMFHDSIYPLKGGKFIIQSNRVTGFLNLWMIEKGKEPVALTNPKSRLAGHSEIEGACLNMNRHIPIVVDEEKELVFFAAFYETPLRSSLFATSFAPKNITKQEIALLSPPDVFVSNFAIDNKGGHICFASSKLNERTTISIGNLIFNEIVSSKITMKQDDEFILRPFPVIPKIVKFKPTHHKFDLYSAIYLPDDCSIGDEKLLPCMCYVYGGPQSRNVTESFSASAKNFAQLFCKLGYIVVTTDNRGSDDRGSEFEGEIKYKMGQVEIEDQVAGIHHARELGVPIDLERVGVMGWSYGGYASLLAMCQRPDVFRVGICCAPVVQWEAYDTAYTERYMGTPQQHSDAYHRGNIMHYAGNFPDQDGRLVLVHGLQDDNVHFAHTSELISTLTLLGKPYRLVILPGERHGVRDRDSHLNFLCTIAQHLRKNL